MITANPTARDLYRAIRATTRQRRIALRNDAPQTAARVERDGQALFRRAHQLGIDPFDGR